MIGSETVLLLLACVVVYLIFRRKRNYWQRKGVPYEPPLPLIGNIKDVLLFRRNLGFRVSDLHKKFSTERFFGMWIFNVPHLVVRDPDLVKQILIKDFSHFYDRNVTCSENADILTANMMFFMRSQEWKNIRTQTTPMFSSGKMKFIYPSIQNVAKEMVAYIIGKNKLELETKNITLKYATDVICSSAFGVDSHSFQECDTPFTKVGKTVFGITLENAIASTTYFCKSSLVDTFKIKFVNAKIAKFLTETFTEIIAQRESVHSERRDLVDVMIKLKKDFHLNDAQLVGHAAQFFLAGYETTSSTIAFALYELSLNKNIQENLREEILANLDEEGGISYTTLQEMKYLEKIFSETLRKYPILLSLGRNCVKDYKIPGSDVVIEKETAVVISLTGLHYDPDFFPDPQKFDPERFSDENVKTRHPFCYLPFGYGPRNCIGMRMAFMSVKLAIVHIIKNFDVEISDKTDVPLQFSARSFTLHVEKGIYMKYRRIQPK